ncbi:uncharacterized protein LOC144715037 [Wolffia australiana]
MLGTRVPFHQERHRSRNLQRSRSCGSENVVNGGFVSSIPPGKSAVLGRWEPFINKSTVPAASTEEISPSGNLDRFLESTTPSLTTHRLPKTMMSGWMNCDLQQKPYFVLADLWESFKEWSAYGAGVPLILNKKDRVMQYYVPYLSAIQLYVDSRRESTNLRGLGTESDSDYSRDSSSDGSSDCELERGQNRLPIREKHKNSQEGSSSDDQGSEISHGHLLFEFLEKDLPYCREPLTDKIFDLARQFPELKTLRSCDLLPSSWISVAWYPIYRIPTGPTLRDLDACFLTFHSLSTPSVDLPQAATSPVFFSHVDDEVAKISLPSFGMASYKMMGSVWTSGSGCQLAGTMFQVAHSWLQHLHVAHPDFQFFSSHGPFFR